MAHSIQVTSGNYHCSLCGETSNFSSQCTGAVATENRRLEAENRRLAAAEAQEKLRLEAAVALQTKAIISNLLIAAMFLAVAVFYFHGAVDWGNNNVDKVTKSMDAGFDKGQKGLRSVGTAIFGGLMALLGKATFLGGLLRHMILSLLGRGA